MSLVPDYYKSYNSPSYTGNGDSLKNLSQINKSLKNI